MLKLFINLFTLEVYTISYALLVMNYWLCITGYEACLKSCLEMIFKWCILNQWFIWCVNILNSLCFTNIIDLMFNIFQTMDNIQESKGETSPSWYCKEGHVHRFYYLSLEKGCYTGCEGSLFIQINSTMLLHHRRTFVGVEITWFSKPSKGMYAYYMLLFSTM